MGFSFLFVHCASCLGRIACCRAKLIVDNRTEYSASHYTYIVSRTTAWPQSFEFLSSARQCIFTLRMKALNVFEEERLLSDLAEFSRFRWHVNIIYVVKDELKLCQYCTMFFSPLLCITTTQRVGTGSMSLSRRSLEILSTLL